MKSSHKSPRYQVIVNPDIGDFLYLFIAANEIEFTSCSVFIDSIKSLIGKMFPLFLTCVNNDLYHWSSLDLLLSKDDLIKHFLT